MVKCGKPARNILHLMIAHVTASSSSSMTAYRVSASDRNLDPAWIRTQLSSCFCCRTNPSPCRLASVHRRVALLGSKNASVGADVSDCFALTKA